MELLKHQRVGVFIDVQNMYYSAKQLYHAKVNYSEILKNAVNGRQLIRAITYVIKADVGDESEFFNALEKIGYDVRTKPLQTFLGGAKKGDWDVGIAMDIMRLASKLDVVVLVSGDGDFSDLLEHVKALGCRAEVIAFGKTASSKLKVLADRFVDMDLSKDKYLIQSKVKQQGKEQAQEQAKEQVVAKQDIKQGNGRKKEQMPVRSIQKAIPYKSKPQQQKNKQFTRKEFPKDNHNHKRPSFNVQQPQFRPRELSLVEKMNMEQPLLEVQRKKDAVMPSPRLKRAVVKEPPKIEKKKVTVASKKPKTRLLKKKSVKGSAEKSKEKKAVPVKSVEKIPQNEQGNDAGKQKKSKMTKKSKSSKSSSEKKAPEKKVKKETETKKKEPVKKKKTPKKKSLLDKVILSVKGKKKEE